MILVGNFPFNSFLSGFICHVGLFALASKFAVLSILSHVVSSFNFNSVVVATSFFKVTADFHGGVPEHHPRKGIR